jgi:ankyrin
MLVQAAFGRSVEVSRIVAVEPRKRKFHQPIFVSIPLPCPASKINNQGCSLRLLCSVTGSTEKVRLPPFSKY